MRVILTKQQVAALDVLTSKSRLPKPNLVKPHKIVEPEHEFDKQLQVLWVTRLQHHDGEHPFGFPRHAFLRLQDEWDRLPDTDPRKTDEVAMAYAIFIGDEPDEEPAPEVATAPGIVQAASWGTEKPS